MRYRFIPAALATGLLLLGSATPARADRSVTHFCSRPYDRNNESAVKVYRQCIVDFVDEQRAAAKRHAEAANSAIDDWNRFARGY
jgi:hypothetical protein